MQLRCCYEVSLTLGTARSTLFDLAIAHSVCSASVLSSGLTAKDYEDGRLPQWQHVGGAVAVKAARERHFPLDVVAKGLCVRIEHGEASIPKDKIRILNSIAGNENESDEKTRCNLPEHV